MILPLQCLQGSQGDIHVGLGEAVLTFLVYVEEHEISIDLTGLPETESSSPEVDWWLWWSEDEGRVGRKVRASRIRFWGNQGLWWAVAGMWRG